MRATILKLSAGWVLCAAAWAGGGGETTYTYKEHGFQISFPESIRARRYSHTAWWWSARFEDRPRVRTLVEVRNVKEGEGLRAFFAIPEYRDVLRRCTLTRIDIVQLNGARALKLDLDDCGAIFPTDHVQVYFAIASGRSFVIQNCVKKADLEKYAEDIDAIVASFTLIEASCAERF